MPIDPSVVVAGAGLLGTAANAVSTGKTNKKSREWNEMMYNRQRYDARQQWHMQNEYNSPAAQMKRLQEAGLNPNLVYGTGSATQNAPSIDSASAPTWSPRAPQIEASAPIAAYFDTQLRQAQTDNTKAQNTILTNQALLQIGELAALDMKNSLSRATYGNTLELANEQLRQMKSRTHLLDIDATYAEQGKNVDIEHKRGLAEKIWQDLDEQKLRMKGMSQDQKIKQFEIELRKNGINPNDPIYMRMIGRIISEKFNLKNLF